MGGSREPCRSRHPAVPGRMRPGGGGGQVRRGARHRERAGAGDADLAARAGGSARLARHRSGRGAERGWVAAEHLPA